MATKIFKDKKIIIREITKGDLSCAKKLQEYINSLINEEAMLLMNVKVNLKDEKEYVQRVLRGVKSRNEVKLMAEADNKIIGTADVELQRWRRNHIGRFGIAIINGYRGIGLGTALMAEILKLAKNNLKPSPKIFQLEVYENNKPAIALYKKMGFKIVGKIPKQIQYNGKLISEYIMIKIPNKNNI